MLQRTGRLKTLGGNVQAGGTEIGVAVRTPVVFTTAEAELLPSVELMSW